jgi:hypothetical protein
MRGSRIRRVGRRLCTVLLRSWRALSRSRRKAGALHGKKVWRLWRLHRVLGFSRCAGKHFCFCGCFIESDGTVTAPLGAGDFRGESPLQLLHAGRGPPHILVLKVTAQGSLPGFGVHFAVVLHLGPGQARLASLSCSRGKSATPSSMGSKRPSIWFHHDSCFPQDLDRIAPENPEGSCPSGNAGTHSPRFCFSHTKKKRKPPRRSKLPRGLLFSIRSARADQKNRGPLRLSITNRENTAWLSLVFRGSAQSGGIRILGSAMHPFPTICCFSQRSIRSRLLEFHPKRRYHTSEVVCIKRLEIEGPVLGRSDRAQECVEWCNDGVIQP